MDPNNLEKEGILKSSQPVGFVYGIKFNIILSATRFDMERKHCMTLNTYICIHTCAYDMLYDTAYTIYIQPVHIQHEWLNFGCCVGAST